MDDLALIPVIIKNGEVKSRYLKELMLKNKVDLEKLKKSKVNVISLIVIDTKNKFDDGQLKFETYIYDYSDDPFFMN